MIEIKENHWKNTISSEFSTITPIIYIDLNSTIMRKNGIEWDGIIMKNDNYLKMTGIFLLTELIQDIEIMRFFLSKFFDFFSFFFVLSIYKTLTISEIIENLSSDQSFTSWTSPEAICLNSSQSHEF